MQRDLYERAGHLFHRAIELPSDRRAAFLDESCAGDDSLRDAVRRLLDNDVPEASDDLIGRPLLDARADRHARLFGPDDATVAGDGQLGRYRVIREIGRGGMGIVYEAEQDQPRQRVALKVLSAHRATPAALERFRREAEILGQLRHPHIAQIYDTGVFETADGAHPYLAMELIDGTSLTTYLAEHDVPTAQRLDLIADLCDAAQHAHDHGVVHRDLKPENVLVTARGALKVLDFGVARFTRLHAPDASALGTLEGQVIGTLNYMSPEQLAGRGHEVEARADVYSIGVMLFEALAGRQPYDVRNRALADAAQHLATTEPPRLASIDRRFAGDLSTIVERAMERDPARRYASAADLGAELMRVLEHRPIVARPPTWTYRTGKTLRRHRALVTTVTVIGLALASGTAIATVQAISARRAQHAAEQAAASTQAITDFIVRELLLAETPELAQGGTPTLRGAFRRAAAHLSALDDQPQVQANVNQVLGEAFLHIADYPRARTHFRAAHAWREANLGSSHRETIASLLGICSAAKRIPPFDDALPLQIRAHQLALDTHGPLDEQTRLALNNLGTLYERLGRHDDAEAMLRQLLDDHERAGETGSARYEAMHNLSGTLTSLGKHDDAAAFINRAIEGKRRIHGAMHPSTILSELEAAIAAHKTGASARAAERFRELTPRTVQVYGPEHPITTHAREFYARSTIASHGDLAPLEAHLTAAIATRRAATSPDHLRLALNHSDLGLVLHARGAHDEAAASLRTALALFETFAPGDPGEEVARGRLARVLEGAITRE